MGPSGVCAPGDRLGGPITVTTPLNDSIPEGLCQCGCGLRTAIATSSCAKRMQFKGRPYRFIQSHGGWKRPLIEDAVPFKIEGVYCRLIPLTQGLWAIVNESDYRWLMQWKWCAVYDKRTRSFYACTRIYRRVPGVKGRQETIAMHRLILGLEAGDKHLGDHANQNTLDNRRKNLRVATSVQNEQNRKISVANTSGFKGVTFNKRVRKWCAYIRVNGKKINLGLRDTAEAAGALYAEAAQKYHGEFARIA